ncbi:hypothetical protein GPS63_02750 [Acinetobacter haemolyticus]|nr:hypothetical protein [Acinetobacter haemolyticus]NAR17235.1 hypothetical protein [Acinetobacter haemolyticus]NAR29438.1 hypothetical protein [Acinetobacter haemolyticus]NAR35831.1 hypothetical protein [Acinetobacter haemolyticus]NAR48094.1 hypothetical protein [Acinetobacter haemolyticus]NAR63745.1 hypothetical protein [Acinetobacter haemolyticus]
MKKVILGLLILSLSACSDAKQQVVIPKVDKKLNTQHQIKVDGCQISYNNKPIDFNAPLADWLKVFGSDYRKVERIKYGWEHHIDVAMEYYIYDDVGLRLIYDTKAERMEQVIFWLEQSKWNKDFAWETKEQYQARMKDPDSAQAKQHFKDGIQVEDVIVGAYPMDQELRSVSKHRRGTSYYILAKCKNGQDGKSFDIDLSTSYDNDPEVIDGMSFENMMVHDLPEDVSLKQQYENCKGFTDNDIMFGIAWDCPDIRKRYYEKFGKEQVEQ